MCVNYCLCPAGIHVNLKSVVLIKLSRRGARRTHRAPKNVLMTWKKITKCTERREEKVFTSSSSSQKIEQEYKKYKTK